MRSIHDVINDLGRAVEENVTITLELLNEAMEYMRDSQEGEGAYENLRNQFFHIISNNLISEGNLSMLQQVLQYFSEEQQSALQYVLRFSVEQQKLEQDTFGGMLGKSIYKPSSQENVAMVFNNNIQQLINLYAPSNTPQNEELGRSGRFDVVCIGNMWRGNDGVWYDLEQEEQTMIQLNFMVGEPEHNESNQVAAEEEETPFCQEFNNEQQSQNPESEA